MFCLHEWLEDEYPDGEPAPTFCSVCHIEVSRAEPYRVLFLDIDGVLNSQEFLLRTHAAREAFLESIRDKKDVDQIEYWSQMIDPEAVRVLNLIIEVSNAKIVISSSWRIGHPLADIRACLERHGFKGDVIDKTENHVEAEDRSRGHQIHEWLSRHPEVEEFVILDDDSDMAHLKPKLVHTSWADGLQKKHLNDALKQLGI